MREREHKQGGEAEGGYLRVGSQARVSIPGPQDHDLSLRQMLNQLSCKGDPT